MVCLVDLLVITFLKSAYDIFAFHNCYTVLQYVFFNSCVAKYVFP